MPVPRVSSRRIVTGIGTSSASASVPTITTPVRRIVATTDQVQDPVTLVRFFNTIQDIIAETTLGARSSPDLGAIILGPYVATGQIQDISHGLGRSPVSVTCARAIGAAWTGYEVATTSAQLDPSKQTRIQFPAAGTFYLRFA